MALINKTSQKIFSCLVICMIIVFESTCWLQQNLHDAGLNIIYKETLKSEEDLTKILKGCLMVFEAEEQRMKLMSDNLISDYLKYELGPKIDRHIKRTYSVIDILDRSAGLIDVDNGPWKNNPFYLFFFNRSKRAVRQKISIIDQNIKAYLYYSNHMTEGDRLVLIFEALIELNKYVLEFTSKQFSEISKYKKEKDIFMR